jgi:phosphoglycolate phosphatase-like HAD superfamily hydrolase
MFDFPTLRALPFALALTTLPALAQDLPSWRDTDTRTAIVEFVTSSADPKSPQFVPDADRIAVFDNDGTLWGEQPVYFQFFFALDRAKELAAADPAWASTPALQAAAAGDIKGVLAGGEAALVEVVTATHSGLTVEDFTAEAAAWIATATHPVSGKRFSEMTYQPMLELLDLLRDHGYRTYIVSGGGVDFMRAFAEDAYGIPPEQVIGSMGKASFAVVDGVAQVMKDPGIAFIDDKEGKPIAIARHIGKRPVFVAGNSDGDLAMLQWGTSGPGPRMGLIVHHTDGVRETAYDRDSAIGRLDRALDEAPAKGWVVVDMAADWARIYPDDTAE